MKKIVIVSFLLLTVNMIFIYLFIYLSIYLFIAQYSVEVPEWPMQRSSIYLRLSRGTL